MAFVSCRTILDWRSNHLRSALANDVLPRFIRVNQADTHDDIVRLLVDISHSSKISSEDKDIIRRYATSTTHPQCRVDTWSTSTFLSSFDINSEPRIFRRYPRDKQCHTEPSKTGVGFWFYSCPSSSHVRALAKAALVYGGVRSM